jgi:hypothetical protein
MCKRLVKNDHKGGDGKYLRFGFFPFHFVMVKLVKVFIIKKNNSVLIFHCSVAFHLGGNRDLGIQGHFILFANNEWIQ